MASRTVGCSPDPSSVVTCFFKIFAALGWLLGCVQRRITFAIARSRRIALTAFAAIAPTPAPPPAAPPTPCSILFAVDTMALTVADLTIRAFVLALIRLGHHLQIGSIDRWRFLVGVEAPIHIDGGALDPAYRERGGSAAFDREVRSMHALAAERP